MIFDNNFNISDAAIYGGVLGFVEESVRIEGEDNDDSLDESIDDYLEKSPKTPLHLLYNENPSLVRHLIKRAYQSRQRAYEKAIEEEIQEAQKEMREEITAQEKEEEWKMSKNNS